MKKQFVTIFLIVSLVLCGFVGCASNPPSNASSSVPQSAPSSHPQRASVTLINNTGYTIYYVYISETASSSWGSDLLRSDQVVRNRESVTLDLPNPRASQYDIRLVDADGDQYTKMDVTVRAGSRLEFTISDIRYPSVTIVNNTGHTINFLYTVPPGADEIGDDRLRSDQVIRNGQSVSVQLPHFLGTQNTYNVMAVTNNRNVYLKTQVNVKNNNRVEFRNSDFVSQLD